MSINTEWPKTYTKLSIAYTHVKSLLILPMRLDFISSTEKGKQVHVIIT